MFCDETLLNRLMKEYLVHIEVEDKDNSQKLTFRSSSLTVLFLAMDDFRKTMWGDRVSDDSTLEDVQSALNSLTTKFERELTTVEERDQLDEEADKAKNGAADEVHDDGDDDDAYSAQRARREPPLRIAHPGAA